MKPDILTESFQRSLKNQGFPIGDIQSDMAGANERRGQVRVVRNWTGLPNVTIRGGIFNEERDVLAPQVNQAILAELKPWRENKVDQDLPTVTVKQVSRGTGLSPERVIKVLSQYPLSFSVNGSSFTTNIQRPEFPDRRLKLSDSRTYGLSASRVARTARYLSRPAGGGPVQKQGIQDRDVDSLIRRKAWEEQEIVFNQIIIPEEKEAVDYGVMEELEAPSKPKTKTVEEVIYAEPKGQKIMQVFEWFKQIGFGKNWVYKTNEVTFAENLAKLSRGEPVDFLTWNCIGFSWFEDPKGEMPTCDINTNSDAAITPFFKDRIQQTITALAAIGNPELTILIPSNEAFDGRVWRYRQPYEERELVINDAVAGLTESFGDLSLPRNTRLNVMRWDNYLRSRGLESTPEDYSRAGEDRIRQSVNFTKITREAVRSGRGYFAQNGVRKITDEALLARQIMYYGVYAGEGVAFEDLQGRGRNVVVVNFEEMRVPQMAFLGSGGNLSIVTPIKSEQMVSYYRWEARRVQKR